MRLDFKSAHTVKQYGLTVFTWSLLCLLMLTACSGQDTTNKPASPTKTTSSTASFQCTSKSSTPVTLNMAYSSEKQTWMDAVVADFNRQNITACDGPITVKATPMGSGQSMQQIVDGTIQPDIWSPAGNVWITLINAKWREKHGTDLISTGANDTPSLVSSPVVIAMWKPQAEALGWPNKAIGWSDIARLSTDPQGWRAYGHPEFGDFKFGHTHPDYSNSGLDAVIAMNYAAVNKTRALTAGDIANAKTRAFVTNVESSVIHYGDSTGFFADNMFKNGPGYLSAAVMYENLVVEANSGQIYKNLAYPVVAIYPKEGTFYSDHPFTILQNSGMTPAKKAAALAFRSFLLAPAQQQKALQDGFRPANPQVQLTAPLDSAHGIDTSQPKTLLQVPNADLVSAIQDNWNQQRRLVDVMLVLDRSGSMNDQINGASKIDGAKQGLTEFVKLVGDQDQLGLTIFSTQTDILSPVSILAPKRQDILSRINGILAIGSTRLYDTISEQVQKLQAMPSKHIKAVVVLTDGQDTSSQLNEDQLVRQITARGENAGNSVKVFTIAYGSDADQTALTRIATATGGQEYAGNPQNIREVYNQISEFF
ncbi:substrate-binding and vWA domain-containing protein [Dictyobacter kobayashii]|uniref:VWA domain-containing protein n=1 Tax=Dictyobacter kobayashii TaxID=2014872 RepID=A0A402ALE2_9CHLR|nr:VWA domain-containing protein [Dictyobacter kobayashii]GCE19951.1 VWA domain-containing protein [Dictyobacter kobayashii]